MAKQARGLWAKWGLRSHRVEAAEKLRLARRGGEPGKALFVRREGEPGKALFVRREAAPEKLFGEKRIFYSCVVLCRHLCMRQKEVAPVSRDCKTGNYQTVCFYCKTNCNY